MDNSAILAAAAAADAAAIDTSMDPERVLLVDGDALAYSCAGNDDTDPAQARINLIDKVRHAQRVSGSGQVQILLTMPGSHKGHRYAIARYKPYQGQRTNSRRPKNWKHLRNLLEGSMLPFPVHATNTAEADDLFGLWSCSRPHGKTVIFTEDKDMRMVPGIHLTWREYLLIDVPPGTWSLVNGDKVYGEKWFWLQMLHGDPADYVPGLPNFKNAANVVKLMGPATAEKVLANAHDRETARKIVRDLYVENHSEALYYEQAILLWMRRDTQSHWFDVFQPGNPLHTDGWMTAAYEEMQDRVAQAEVLNATTQAE